MFVQVSIWGSFALYSKLPWRYYNSECWASGMHHQRGCTYRLPGLPACLPPLLPSFLPIFFYSSFPGTIFYQFADLPFLQIFIWAMLLFSNFFVITHYNRHLISFTLVFQLDFWDRFLVVQLQWMWHSHSLWTCDPPVSLPECWDVAQNFWN